MTIKKIYDTQTSTNVTLNCWLRTIRGNKNILFLAVNDGTDFRDLQVVVRNTTVTNFAEISSLQNHSALTIMGKIVLTPQAKQPLELQAETIIIRAHATPTFPIQNKKHSDEFLRDNAHLRTWTKKYHLIMFLRSKLIFYVEQFFDTEGFVHLHAPIISSNDCEGAGEVFTVLTSDQDDPTKYIPFYNQKTTLSVSGQLHAESYALNYQKVYTFNPIFRSEKSHTNRHTSEFYMIEPEMAFVDLPQIMAFAERFVKTIAQKLLNHHLPELTYLNDNYAFHLLEQLRKTIKTPFHKMTYDQALAEIAQAPKKGISFVEQNLTWGDDLSSEHEKYLAQLHQTPCFVYNYPRDLKAFYMKVNRDQPQTVAAFDLLVPEIGELIGGSEREADYEMLLAQLASKKLKSDNLEWYLQLRNYGYFTSAGFGVGFERLLMFLLNINNIRDVLPFPRNEKNLLF